MRIPLSVPNLQGNEEKYLLEALKDEWVSTAGPHITRLEKMISEYLGIDQSVACQSGTAGLHLSLLASEIGSSDEVIVPTLSFIASANPVVYVGASPVFMDCDESFNLDLDKLEEFCHTQCHMEDGMLINNYSLRPIKAIIVVHIFGNMMDMERVMSIAGRYNLVVIEDATEAIGSYVLDGKYKGFYAGTIGDFGVFSFNGNKIITTGGGGLVCAKDLKKISMVRYLSTQAKELGDYYIHNAIGYNYRMTNIQAAIGLAQLEQLDKFIECKTRNYNLYHKGLLDLKGVQVLAFNEKNFSNHWFYTLLIDEVEFGQSREVVIEKLKGVGIQTRPIWGLIHQQKPYKKYQTYSIEKALIYADQALNIPCSTNLKEEEINFVIENIHLLANTK